MGAGRDGIYYHTTERAEAEVILQEGFMASYASLGEAVYLYGTLASAQAFARQRSYRTFDDPVVLAVRDERPRKVDRADLEGEQDPRVYADVWIVHLDEDAGEDRFRPAASWVADARPRGRHAQREPLPEPDHAPVPAAVP